MNLSPYSAAFLAALLLPATALAQEEGPILRLDADASLSFRSSAYWDEARVDRLPPAAVPHTERLAAGAWMFHYRAFITELEGNGDGRDDVSNAQIFALGFSETPTRRTTVQHDFEFLYGYDEIWTLFASLPYLDHDMDVAAMGGGSTSISSSGVGDLKVGGIRNLYEGEGEVVRMHIGLGVPTGATDEKSGGALLPYQMQLGTGTFDLFPGVTYLVQKSDWSWGAQARGRIHMGKNSDDWARGDEGNLGIWAATELSADVAGSLRLDYYGWSDYHGSNKALDPTFNPAFDPHTEGGERLDLYAGATWQLGSSRIKEQQLGIEFGLPLAEWLDGPQLQTQYIANLSWHIAF